MCVGAFFSYFLAKIVPYWGLALLATTVVFFAPLVYRTNQELIDHYLKEAGDAVNEQTSQIRELVQKNTEQATQLTKQYMGDYTAKAQAMIRGAPAAPTHNAIKETDFPAAPQEELHHEEEKAEEEEPLIES